jgi:lipid A 4'-phosphatase
MMPPVDPPGPAARAAPAAAAPRRGLGLRRRELRCGAALWLLAALVFSGWPQLDLAVSGLFYARDSGFVGAQSPLILAIHHSVPWVGRLCALLALAVAALQWLRPGWLGPRTRRRVYQLGWVFALGVGLLVNGALKEGWGRARPQAVAMFGGPATFTPALQPSRQCRTNCSFVSGHAATGFAFMALGLFGRGAVRRRYLLVGAAAGSVLGLVRISQGGHFASDIVFAGLVVWLSGCIVRGVWLRLRARRMRRRREAARAAGASSSGSGG